MRERTSRRGRAIDLSDLGDLMTSYGDGATIRKLLHDGQTWAIVGLGDNPSRPAYGVARFLKARGKRIVPVHPTAATVHDEQGYATLAEIPFSVDVVDVFRRSEFVDGVADEAIAIGAKGLWLQLGVIDAAAADRAAAAGLDVVMDRCPAIEWSEHGPAA